MAEIYMEKHTLPIHLSSSGTYLCTLHYYETTQTSALSSRETWGYGCLLYR